MTGKKIVFNSIAIKKFSLRHLSIGKKKAPHEKCRAFFVYF